jgi:hypothetical protein
MRWIVGFALAFASLTVAPASAEEIAISGTVAYSATSTTEKVLTRQTMKGTIEADGDDSIIDGAEQECYGSFAFLKGKDGTQPVAGHGFCDTVDKDGDVWWLVFNAGGERSKWEVVGGTGKYEGMTGSGETFFEAQSPVVVAAAAPTGWIQKYEGTLILPSR